MKAEVIENRKFISIETNAVPPFTGTTPEFNLFTPHPTGHGIEPVHAIYFAYLK
jgi:hypothetical protein